MPDRIEPTERTDRPWGRNDPCHCGQRKKYKNCCMAKDRAAGRHPTLSSAPIAPLTNLETLRRNTLDFIECLRGDLSIETDHRTGHGVIRSAIDDGAVKRTFDRLPFFFPHKADYARVYQDIAASETSGMYWGDRDVNSIAAYLARYALYTPHIIVANPFCDRMLYHLDRSPIEHPAEWRQVVANRAMFLLSIEPWIREGVVTVLPTLKWADWQLHDNEIRPLARKRVENFSPEQRRAGEKAALVDLLMSLHPNEMAAFIRSEMPNVSASDVGDLVRCAEQELAENPARYAWCAPGENRVLHCNGPGNSLEAAVYQAALCKSYLLLGKPDYRAEYESAVKQSDSAILHDALTQMSRAFATCTFSFLNSVNLDFVLGLRKDNRLASLRRFLHETWKQASTVEGIERLNADAAFRESLEGEYATYKQEWKDIQKGLLASVVVGSLGAAVSVLTGQFGLSVASGGLAAFKLRELVAARAKRAETERLPLGVFLQLERGN